MVIKIIFTLLLIFLFYQFLIRLVRRFWKFPAPAFIGRFLDSRARKILQPVDKIISRSKIEEGKTALEIGCGSGAFTTDVARSVGNSGLVLALDIEIKMLEQVKIKLNKTENRDIDNIKMIQANAYNLPFSDNSIDIVYMIAVFQEIPDKNATLNEIIRILKHDGRLAISEFIVDPDYPLKSTTIKIVKNAGFILEKVSGNLFNYTITFKIN